MRERSGYGTCHSRAKPDVLAARGKTHLRPHFGPVPNRRHHLLIVFQTHLEPRVKHDNMLSKSTDKTASPLFVIQELRILFCPLDNPNRVRRTEVPTAQRCFTILRCSNRRYFSVLIVRNERSFSMPSVLSYDNILLGRRQSHLGTFYHVVESISTSTGITFSW